MATFPTLPLSNIVPVSVVVSPIAPAGPAFNQGLVVGPSTVIPSVGPNSRVQLYTSLSQMITAGFTTNEPEYLAAELYFGQTPTPTFLNVGRQDTTALQTVAVGASGGTGYVIGDILTVVQSGASFGLVKVTTIGGSGAVTGIATIQGSQGTGYAVASNLATTGGTGTGAEVTITVVGETPLQSVIACRQVNPQWYICEFVGTATDSDTQAIAAFAESASPVMQFFHTTGEAAVLNNTTPNIAATLQALGYRRTQLAYSTTQSGAFPNNVHAVAAVMGYAMGANNGGPGSYFTLNNKTLAGVAAEPLSQTQVNNIMGTVSRSAAGLNCNLYLNYANGSYLFYQPGIQVGGTWFDEVLFLDMLVSAIQVNVVNLFATERSVPITDSGVLLVRSVINQALAQSQAIGFIAPSGVWTGQTIGTGPAQIVAGDPFPNGYSMYNAPVSTLSQAQKSNRQLPPITIALIAAQSANSLSVSIVVQQ